jgi:hypothetical protein
MPNGNIERKLHNTKEPSEAKKYAKNKTTNITCD